MSKKNKNKNKKKAAVPMYNPIKLSTPTVPIITRKEQTITLCLVMIVKDEEDTIKRCLTAVAPFIKYWIIVDTGSSDNTKEIIRQTMDELAVPGELHERPWVNFEVNRTESLRLAEGKCDYRWIIDADDTFTVDSTNINPFAGLDTTPDCYQILYRLNALQYHRAQIVKSNQNWIYKGVLHEYLHLDEPNKQILQTPVPHCKVIADISPLKRASSLEEKYSKDAEILEKALIDEPTNDRYMFYLAQSYRDSEQIDKAIEAYGKRIAMGGWEEEIYYSMYMIAKLNEKKGEDAEKVANLYLKAWEYRPSRLEAVFHTMRKLREQKRFLVAFALGDVAIKTKGTTDILFLEPEIWQWRLLDEYSLAAYYIGNPDISLEKTQAIVNAPFFKDIPPDERERVNKNLEFYKRGAQEKAKRIAQMQAMQQLQAKGR